MNLFKSLSSIIALTGCAVITFLLRRKIMAKFSISRKASKQDYPKLRDLPNPNWVKVGHVEKLNINPLYTGKSLSCSALKFTNHGIITKEKGLDLWDGMFQIYDEQTKTCQNSDNLEAITLIDTIMVTKSQVQFYAPDTPDRLTIDLHDITVTSKTCKIVKELKTNWIIIRYIDCGDDAADWVNKYLQKSTLRLLRVAYVIIGERYLSTKVIMETDAVEAWKLLMKLTRHTVITLESLNESYTINPSTYLQIKPNIIISAPSFPAFAEKDWEWMRIGNVIMKNMTPFPGTKSSKPYLGTCYGLYHTGDVNVNDDVFVHMKELDFGELSSDDE